MRTTPSQMRELLSQLHAMQSGLYAQDKCVSITLNKDFVYIHASTLNGDMLADDFIATRLYPRDSYKDNLSKVDNLKNIFGYDTLENSI